MYEYSALVTNVVDGDTVDAEVDLGFNVHFKARFRLKGLDTPEIRNPASDAEKEHGVEATSKALAVLLNKTVTLRSSKKPGIYGRWEASIDVHEIGDYAQYMIENGFQKKEVY